MADKRIDVPGVVISIGEAEGSAGRVHRVTLDLVEGDVVKLAHAGVLTAALVAGNG